MDSSLPTEPFHCCIKAVDPAEIAEIAMFESRPSSHDMASVGRGHQSAIREAGGSYEE
jgi:hypothetical protein